MNFQKHLRNAAASTSHLYKLVFTSLMLFELVRFRFRSDDELSRRLNSHSSRSPRKVDV